MKKWFLPLFFGLMMLGALPVLAEGPLPEIPGTLPEAQRLMLETQRTDIVQKKEAINKMVERFNVTCNEVPENSPELKRCIGEQQVIRRKKEALIKKIKAFKEMLARVTNPETPVASTPVGDVTRLGGSVANMVMDAIQENAHDLDKASDSMARKLRENPGGQELRDATSYVLGMAIGNNTAQNPVPQLSEDQLLRDRASVSSVQLFSGTPADRVSPFPVSPRELESLQKWEDARNKIFLDALSRNPDSFSNVREELEKKAKDAPGDLALRAALRIAQGAEVYQSDIERAGPAAR